MINIKYVSPEHQKWLQYYGLPESANACLEYITYEKGECLVREGGEMEYLLFIIKGNAKVVFSVSTGRSLLLSFYKGKGVLGDIELMLGCLADSTVQALTDMECIGINRKKHQDYLKSDVFFLNYVGKSLSDKLRRLTIHSAMNQLIPLDNRLCAYILMVAEENCFIENLTETADLLGTSYRHLLRTLTGLCEQEVIQRVSMGRYMIRDRAFLEMQARDYYREG